jgi:hypothetical protein
MRKHKKDRLLNFHDLQVRVKRKEQLLFPHSSQYISIWNALQKLNDADMASVPTAEYIIEKYLNSVKDESQKDSIFLSFNQIFYAAANAMSDSFDTKYKKLLSKIDSNREDRQTRDFRKCLSMCGMQLYMEEGNWYLDMEPSYMLDIFKGRISPAMDEYLEIRSKEIKEGFSDDAGLLISFNELYKRVIAWESFTQRYPHFFMDINTSEYSVQYMSTLLTGMDNSPVFSYEDDKLDPEIKKLYESIINRHEPRKSTRIISEYYDLLRANNFKQPNGLDTFLTHRGLYSMSAVQPFAR